MNWYLGVFFIGFSAGLIAMYALSSKNQGVKIGKIKNKNSTFTNLFKRKDRDRDN